MRICHYNNNHQAGAVVDEKVYAVGGAVTKDEIRKPQNLSIHVEQNGKPAMTAHTSDMIRGLHEHIRFLTSCRTLRPGDLITIGAPAGVKKLKDGDHLKGAIEKIGMMELHVKAETS